MIFTLAVLAIIAIVLVYAFATFESLGSGRQVQANYLTAPGTPCTDPTLPSNITNVEQSAAFVEASGGLCYNYIEGQTVGSGATNQTLVFNYYNGTVIYPCGTFPAELIASQMDVAVSPAFAVEYIQLNTNASSLNDTYDCGANPPAAGVVSVQYIEVTIPALPEVNVTLYSPTGGQPVTGLKAVLTLAGSNYTISFGVSQSSPLLPGQSTSAIQVVNQAVTNTTQIYPMRISGTFLDGPAFVYQVQVVIASPYASAQ